MGRRCLRLCNASLMGNGALLGAGIWQWQRGTNAVAGEVSLHCNQSLQSAPTLNLLNVPTDVEIYPRPSRQPAMLISLVESWSCFGHQ